jgi:phosphate transport system substrate-binding protein
MRRIPLRKRLHLRTGLSLALLGALTLAACTSTGAEPNGSDGISGDIFVSGSSTVEPITTLVAEKFAEHNPRFGYDINGPGTGDGFALFCNGETDISDASRPIKDEEAADCEANGIEYVEVLVAYDGLAVLTSAQNDSFECLSFLDLYALLGPESQGFNRWSDANELAAELESQLGSEFGESHAPYPDAELTIAAPGEESGTYDTFIEIAIAKIADERGESHQARADYVASANDNVIIEGIAGTPSSLGWVGLAFARENTDVVRTIEIDEGNGCVGPSDDTVVDRTYPIARPLFIYVNRAAAEDNEALAAFVDFYLSDEGLASVAEVGYVELSSDEVASARSAWEGR